MTRVTFVTVEGVDFTQEEAENAFITEIRVIVNALKLMDENKKSFYGNVLLTFVFFPFILWGSISLVSGIGSAIIFGVLLGVNYGWIGTLGHDVGHGQALRKHKRAQSHLKLFLGNVCLGFSHDWWEDKHNRHHFWSHVNEKDPDTTLPLAMSAEQARDRGLTANSFRVKHARWIFPLLLPLQAFFARISSWKYVNNAGMSPQMKRVQRLTMTLHVVLYVALVLTIALHAGLIPALVFALVNQGTHGLYNSSIFATNHKETPVVGKNEDTRWVWRQLYSSHNVASGNGPIERAITWMMGALNYQIEHHLFQTMPRYNLRRLRPHVKEIAAKYNLPYNESGLFRSYWNVFCMWSRVSHDLLESPMGA